MKLYKLPKFKMYKLKIPKLPKLNNSLKGMDNQLKKSFKFMAWSMKDSDKDGMPNIIDCQPYNPKKQGVKPNRLMRQRLSQLPIYITTKQPSFSSRKRHEEVVKNIRHIQAKDVPRKERQQVYSVLKKYPNLISDIERSKSQGVYFTNKPILERNKLSNVKGYATSRGAVISTRDINRRGLEATRETASYVGHELKHTRQEVYIGRTKGGIKRYEKLRKGEYWQRPIEVKAREAGEKVAFSQPSVTKKLIQRQIDQNKKRVAYTNPATFEKHYVPIEEAKEMIKQHQTSEQESASYGLKKLSNKADVAEQKIIEQTKEED